MNLNKAGKRDRRIQKRQHGHREDGRSVFTIRKAQKDRAKAIKKQRVRKETALLGE